MVRHFRHDLEQLLVDTYRSGAAVEDPYELVKVFCVENGTKACKGSKIPSLERKKNKRPEL